MLAGLEVDGPCFDRYDGVENLACVLCDQGIDSQGDLFLAFFRGCEFDEPVFKSFVKRMKIGTFEAILLHAVMSVGGPRPGCVPQRDCTGCRSRG